MTTHRGNAPGSAGWKCYPAYHGLALRKSSDTAMRFLPADADDRFLEDVPLSFVLTDHEYELLTAKKSGGGDSAVAATFYGPSEQDKTSNEDFALAAVVPGAKRSTWSFAAVADGVGTKTFWAARTSRLACLVAFREFRTFVERAGTLSDADLEHFRRSLAVALRDALEHERRLLLDRGKVPPRWSPEYFAAYQHRDELWFNSTLIVAALGASNGFALWAGDGGIHLRKRNATRPETSDTVVMASKDDSRLDSCVSLRVAPDQFRVARIGYDGSSGVELYLSSDGVDRTLQRRNDGGYPKLSLRNPAEAARVLRELAESKEAERDNFSIARISHEVSAEVILALPAEAPPQTAQIPMLPPPREPEGEVVDAKPQKPDEPRPLPSPTIFSFLLFALGSACGFSAGLLVMRFLHAQEQPTAQSVRFRRPASQAVLPAVEPQLPQLAIGDAVRKGLNEKSRNDELEKFVRACVGAMKAQPGVYTLVAYADRADAADSADCKQNAKVSLARSHTVAAWIQDQLEAEQLAGRASIFASQRVCDSPQPGISITDVRARRLVLVRGTVTNCTCP